MIKTAPFSQITLFIHLLALMKQMGGAGDMPLADEVDDENDEEDDSGLPPLEEVQ
jgi:hypothetical protein